MSHAALYGKLLAFDCLAIALTPDPSPVRGRREASAQECFIEFH